MDPDSTLSMISIVKFVSLGCAGLFSVLGAMTESKRDGKLTKWGRVAIIGVMLSTLFSVSLLGLEQQSLAANKKKADDERAEQQAQATREKEEANAKFAQTVERLEAIQSVAGDNLEQTGKNLELTDAVSVDVRKNTKEQTKIVGQTRGIAKDLGLSLRTQETQVGQMENLALDRDLNGIELSWKPSEAQWNEIVKAYEKLPGHESRQPGDARIPDKNYFQHTTITAERFYEHWRIIFKPLLRPQGLLEFPPVLTSQRGWESFTRVLGTALPSYFVVELGSNPPIVLSGGGFYPSSISIHRDKITISLKPPDTRIALKYLEAKQVTFKGSRYIDKVSLVSRDSGVCLNQTIDLNWGDEVDEFEPSISGPHPLDIKFATLSECQ